VPITSTAADKYVPVAPAGAAMRAAFKAGRVIGLDALYPVGGVPVKRMVIVRGIKPLALFPRLTIAEIGLLTVEPLCVLTTAEPPMVIDRARVSGCTLMG